MFTRGARRVAEEIGRVRRQRVNKARKGPRPVEQWNRHGARRYTPDAAAVTFRDSADSRF